MFIDDLIIVLLNENGTFPNLDAYVAFTVEHGNSWPNSHRGKVPKIISSDSGNSDDADFRREAYWLATNSKKWRKKFKGKKADKRMANSSLRWFGWWQ